MANARLFYLRRQANALHRSWFIQKYSNGTAQRNPTKEDHVAFLQAQDQKLLRETTQRANDLIEHINKVKRDIAKLPTTVQKDPSLPPYTIGFIRSKIQDIPKTADTVISRAEHVKEHLHDLQYEPYPDRSKSSMAAWEAQIANMGPEQKEVALKNLRLQEEASLVRLKRDCERLLLMVKDIETMSKKSGVAVDEPMRSQNPFSSNADGEQQSYTHRSRAESKLANGAAEGLLEMQKQLEAQYSQTKPVTLGEG